MMGYDQDHGYFGKGLDGYVHYKQAFDRNSRSSGGGPGRAGTQAALPW